MFQYVEALRPLEIHIQVAEPSVEGLQQHIAYVRNRMKARSSLPAKQRFAYVIQQNGGQFRQANAAERKVLADWMKDDADLFRVASLGVSFVIDSAMIRGALTAVFWLTSTPVPYRVHGTLDEAVQTAMREITAAGIDVPEVLLRERADAARREIAKVTSAAKRIGV